MTAESSLLARFPCPIEPQLSPHADAAQQWLVEWVDRHGPAMNEAARQRLANSLIARYAGRIYPGATLPTCAS